MPPSPEENDAPEPRYYGPLLSLGKMFALPALGLPVLVVLFEADTLSISGWLYAISLFACGVGCWRGPPLARFRPGPGTIGALVFLTVAVARLASSGDDPRGHLTLEPSGESGRFLSRLFEERDGAILGARMIGAIGANEGEELERLGEVMTEHYPRMDAEGLALGTPILATYADLQSPEAFDGYVFEPNEPSTTALVFLHGSGGSFVLMCWQLARTATRAGLWAHCPAMSASGRWNTELGRAILDAQLDALARRGIERVVLAGLSNGALALSEMAPSLLARRHEAPRIVGLVLVSGVRWEAEATSLPTLVLHGREDTMTRVEPARSYAEGAANVELVELPSGHFAILEDHERVEEALGAFLEGRIMR